MNKIISLIITIGAALLTICWRARTKAKKSDKWFTLIIAPREYLKGDL